MADLDITQMTQLAVAPAVDDILYIGDISEVVLDDQNKYIEIEDLFQYLNNGYLGNIVLNTAATLDLSVGAVHLNEAVDLIATSTELNQLDGVSVGGSSAGDIATIDGTQTLTNKTLTTPTIGDLTNANHDHSNVAGGGTLVYSVTIPVYGAAEAVVAGEKGIIVIPSQYNGLDLTAVICGVWDKGVTGTTDIGIYRSRAGSEVAMLSTEVTIGDEWYAQDGVINTANDDVATGDLINVNISGIHSGTAPNGLTVTLEFS